VFVNKAKLLPFVVAVLVAVVLYLVLEYTCLGKALRAAADGGQLHGHRRGPVLPHRLRPGPRHHGRRGRADNHLTRGASGGATCPAVE
jgi:hypothetical protein